MSTHCKFSAFTRLLCCLLSLPTYQTFKLFSQTKLFSLPPSNSPFCLTELSRSTQRSTSSSHLEYANGLPPVTNPIYYQGAKPVQSYSASQLMNRQSQPQLNLVSSAANSVSLDQPLTQPLGQPLGQPIGQHPLAQTAQSIGQHPPVQTAQQPYNYNNHWVVQEAEYRRQRETATQNGSSLIPSTKGQPNRNLINKISNPYKDDQPLYENTFIYNSHKKQQMANSMPYLAANSQINKPPFPNPSMIGVQQPATISQSSLSQSSMVQSSMSQNSIQNSSMSSSQQSNYMPASQQQKQQKQILSVSGKKRCSSCGDELGMKIVIYFERSDLDLKF